MPWVSSLISQKRFGFSKTAATRHWNQKGIRPESYPANSSINERLLWTA